MMKAEAQIHRLLGSLTLASGLGASIPGSGSGLIRLLDASGYRIAMSVAMMAIGTWLIVFSYFPLLAVRCVFLIFLMAMWTYLGIIYYNAGVWSAVGWVFVIDLFAGLSLVKIIWRE